MNVDFALGSANSGERPTLETTDLDNGICHVRINNSLGDQELVRKFDEVADRLGEGNRLILDLRNTPGGGNTMVARGVMGRLLHKELAYQRHEFLESPLQIPRVWVEYALPRGQKQFTGPVVVLVGRWTGSMGEGIAIGLDNRPSTTIVRNRMAGLKGATQKFSAGHSSTGIFLPVEKLFHIDGVPREDFEPSVFVNPKTTPKGSKFGNQVLHAAVDLLSTRN